MPGKGIGHFFGAMRVDAFRNADAFKKDMDQWLKRFRRAKPAKGFDRVLVPGDPERLMEEDRKKNGIPLMHAVVEDLVYLAEKFKIRPPEV
jgi:LDH2 family malate/lactate/ureidoglycolate dehydrogenase